MNAQINTNKSVRLNGRRDMRSPFYRVTFTFDLLTSKLLCQFWVIYLLSLNVAWFLIFELTVGTKLMKGHVNGRTDRWTGFNA